MITNMYFFVLLLFVLIVLINITDWGIVQNSQRALIVVKKSKTLFIKNKSDYSLWTTLNNDRYWKCELRKKGTPKDQHNKIANVAGSVLLSLHMAWKVQATV